MSRQPRTCCTTHADRCRFGDDHYWSGPFITRLKQSVVFWEPPAPVWSHPDDVKCATCGGICYGNRPDAEIPAEHVGRH